MPRVLTDARTVAPRPAARGVAALRNETHMTNAPGNPAGAQRLARACGDYEEEGVRALAALVEREPPTDAWLDALIAGAREPDSDVVATWLLRAYLERGADLDRSRVAALLRSLPRLQHDDAKLHLCQSVALLDVPTRSAEPLARFLRPCAEGEAKFLRAWAVDAFVRLARQHSRYADEAGRWLERARRDPAASVRARARRIDAERPG